MLTNEQKKHDITVHLNKVIEELAEAHDCEIYGEINGLEVDAVSTEQPEAVPFNLSQMYATEYFHSYMYGAIKGYLMLIEGEPAQKIEASLNHLLKRMEELEKENDHRKIEERV